MNESQKPIPNKRNQTSSNTTDTDEDGENDELPTVTELFTILGDECEHLPYDPDTVCKTLTEALDDADGDVDVEDTQSIARLTEACTDVTFPDIVITRADITLQNEYSATALTTLLHIMSAHGKSIRDDNCPVKSPVQQETEPTQHTKTRGFMTARTLCIRTTESIRHFGKTTKKIAAQSRTRTKSVFTSNKQ